MSTAPHLTKPLVDLRVYTIALRKMPEFVEVFNRLAMPVLLQTLGHPLGFYTSWVGPQNQFIHLWGYDDLADYERRSRARDTHPAFGEYLAASGHLIVAQENRLIRAVDLPAWRPLP
jgi:hypothetical protein